MKFGGLITNNTRRMPAKTQIKIDSLDPFFIFFDFLHFATLKIHKILSPWRKIMKFGGQEDLIFLSISAKNHVKIASLGPNFGLMSAQKKGIHLYKIGFC